MSRLVPPCRYPQTNMYPPPSNNNEQNPYVRTRTFYNTEYLESRKAHFAAQYGHGGNHKNVNIYGNTYHNLWMHHRKFEVEPLGHAREWDEYLEPTPIRMAKSDPNWTPQKSRTQQISSQGLKAIILGPANVAGMIANELQSYYGARHLDIGETMKFDNNKFFVVDDLRRRGLPIDLYGSDLATRQIDHPYVRENGYCLVNFPRTVNQAKALELNLHQLGMDVDLIILMRCHSGGPYFNEYKLFDERPTAQIFDIDNAIMSPQDNIGEILGFYMQIRSKAVIEVDTTTTFQQAVNTLHRRLAQFYMNRQRTGCPYGFQPSMGFQQYTLDPSNGFQ